MQVSSVGTRGVRHTAPTDCASSGHLKQSPSRSTTSVLLTSEQAAREVFGLSERKFHALRAMPWMPQPVVLGPRLVRWVRSELEQAALNMPREAAPAEPAQLRRARIEAMKAAGTAPTTA